MRVVVRFTAPLTHPNNCLNIIFASRTFLISKLPHEVGTFRRMGQQESDTLYRTHVSILLGLMQPLTAGRFSDILYMYQKDYKHLLPPSLPGCRNPSSLLTYLFPSLQLSSTPLPPLFPPYISHSPPHSSLLTPHLPFPSPSLLPPSTLPLTPPTHPSHSPLPLTPSASSHSTLPLTPPTHPPPTHPLQAEVQRQLTHESGLTTASGAREYR